MPEQVGAFPVGRMSGQRPKLRRPHWAHTIACGLVLALGGCEGVVTAPGGDGSGPGAVGAGGGLAGASGSTGGDGSGLATSHVAIHRLTNEEYTNTTQDLLYSSSRAGDKFPLSSVGESGFKNDSVALAVSPEWVKRVYLAADALANEVIASKGTPGGAYERLATCPSGTSGNACASALLSSFASRAYRRPVSTTSPEVAQLLAAFNARPTFDEGFHDALLATLISPRFLFVALEPPGAAPASAPFVLDGYAIASRLSYFIWQTMPDAAGFAAAAKGDLATSGGRGKELERLLADPRAERLAHTLVREWAGLGALESSTISGLDDDLRTAMIRETDLFLGDLIQNNRSFVSLVRGDYSFVNKPLADLYGLTFPAADPKSFVRVALVGDERRGVLTHASLLTTTAGAPDVTHPVRRGFWVTQRVLCQPPPPPPDNVPPLDHSVVPQSIRLRLEQHVASPACSGCHVVMDTIGLGLENYDPSGRWRDTYPGQSAVIDASGTLPSGAAFTGPGELLSELGSQPDVRACLVKQMLGLALTRTVGPADEALANAVGEAEVSDTGSFSGLLTRLVESSQFLQQAPEVP